MQSETIAPMPSDEIQDIKARWKWIYQILSPLFRLLRFAGSETWKEIRRFFTDLWRGSVTWPWFVALLLGAATVASVDEFGVALVVGELAVISLASNYWHWATKYRATLWTRWVSFPIMVIMGTLLFFEVNEIKGPKPWSHIPKAWDRMMITSTARLESIQLRNPPCPSAPTIDNPQKEGSEKPASRRDNPPLHITDFKVSRDSSGNVSEIRFFFKNVSGEPFDALAQDLIGSMSALDDKKKQAVFEDQAWDMLLDTDGRIISISNSLETTFIDFAVPAGTLQGLNMDDIESGRRVLVFTVLFRTPDKKRRLLEICGYVSAGGDFMHCSRHNWP
jgi:hypothetical protein